MAAEMRGEGLRQADNACPIEDQFCLAERISKDIGDVVDRVAIKPLRIDRAPLARTVLDDVLVMKIAMQRLAAELIV